MRLKSDFKDYYDGCLRLDNEEEPYYIRRSEEIVLTTDRKKQSEEEYKKYIGKVPSLYRVNSYRSDKIDFKMAAFIIGFCQEVRKGIIFTFKKSYAEETIRVVAYSSEEAIKACEEYLPASDWKRFNTRSWGFYNLDSQIKNFFEDHAQEHQKTCNAKRLKEFATADCPIWVGQTGEDGYAIHRSVFIKNPCLNKYDFARIIDPYQAYQTLRMFLCNQAAPREYIPEISDEDMLIAKGFDPKTSFRNVTPGGPARKQRKRARKNKNKNSDRV